MASPTKVRLTRPTYKGASLPASRKKDPPTDEPPSPLYRGGGGGSVSGVGAAVQVLEKNLQNLTPTERQALAEKLLAANLGAVEGGRDVDQWATAVTEALATALKQRGIPAYGVMPVRKVVGAASAWGPVRTFATSAGLDAFSATDRYSAFQLLAGLLVQAALEVTRRTGAPMSLKLVGNLVPTIASIFDAEFPGYLESGLGSVPFRMRIAPTKCAVALKSDL